MGVNEGAGAGHAPPRPLSLFPSGALNRVLRLAQNLPSLVTHITSLADGEIRAHHAVGAKVWDHTSAGSGCTAASEVPGNYAEVKDDSDTKAGL